MLNDWNEYDGKYRRWFIHVPTADQVIVYLAPMELQPTRYTMSAIAPGTIYKMADELGPGLERAVHEAEQFVIPGTDLVPA